MKVPQSLAAGVAMLLLAGPAFAESWVEADRNNNGIYYVDADSIDGNDEGYAMYRIKFLNKNAANQLDGQRIWYQTATVISDCEEDTLSLGQMTAVTVDRNSYLSSAVSEPQPVPFGEPLGVIHNSVCSFLYDRY